MIISPETLFLSTIIPNRTRHFQASRINLIVGLDIAHIMTHSHFQFKRHTHKKTNSGPSDRKSICAKHDRQQITTISHRLTKRVVCMSVQLRMRGLCKALCESSEKYTRPLRNRQTLRLCKLHCWGIEGKVEHCLQIHYQKCQRLDPELVESNRLRAM